VADPDLTLGRGVNFVDGGGVGRKSLNSFKVNYINYYRPLMQNGIHLMFRTGFLRYKLVLLTVQVSGFNCTVAFVNYAFA